MRIRRNGIRQSLSCSPLCLLYLRLSSRDWRLSCPPSVTRWLLWYDKDGPIHISMIALPCIIQYYIWSLNLVVVVVVVGNQQEMADFERHKKSLVTNLLEPPKTLSSEVSKHWSEIINCSYLWDRYGYSTDGSTFWLCPLVDPQGSRCHGGLRGTEG